MRLINWFLNLLHSLFHWDDPSEPTEPKATVVRKPYDTHKFTKQDFDVIMQEYDTYQKCKEVRGAEFKSTLQDVTDKLNELLGYDKSRQSYALVWLGRIERDSLGERLGV